MLCFYCFKLTQQAQLYMHDPNLKLNCFSMTVVVRNPSYLLWKTSPYFTGVIEPFFLQNRQGNFSSILRP